MYYVLKKINNNVVLARDVNGQELLLMGKGLGFLKTPYTLTDDSLIEHVFVDARNNQFIEAFSELPSDVLLVTEHIITSGKKQLQVELNKNLLLTLADHLTFAIERVRDNINFGDNIQFDVRSLYPRETAVGRMAVQMVHDELNVQLPASEAYAVALHFINAEHNFEGMAETYKLTQAITDILSIAEKYMDVPLRDDSIYFSRFVTHVRYFILRRSKGIELSDGAADFLQEAVGSGEKKILQCIDEIESYIQKTYGWNCSSDERIYLMLHLRVLFYYMEKQSN